MDDPRLSIVVAGSHPAGPPTGLHDVLAPRLADGSVELIVSTAATAASALPDHPQIRVLRHPPGTTVPRLRSTGFAAGRAPLVALTEDFCVPGERWVDALVAAHTQTGAIAVGGPIDRRGGMPKDWAVTLLEYGRFFDRERRGAVDDLPGTNVCYDKARLGRCLGVVPEHWIEVAVHRFLRDRGQVLWREPEAVMFDVNDLQLTAAVRAQFHHGRLYGGMRRAESRIAERVRCVLLAPLVPAVLVRRALGNARGRCSGAVPALLALSAAWSFGEAIGWLAGEGHSLERWT